MRKTNTTPKTNSSLDLDPNTHHVAYMEVTSLIAYANNAKKHPAKQVSQIAASIRQFGFINPVIIDERRQIIAGHGRWEAAKLLGLARIPTLQVTHLSEAEIRAYRLADNQLNLNTGFDEILLKIDISELIDLNPDFDLEITGFETATLDLLLSDTPNEHDPADDIPAVDDTPPVTALGDVWVLGKHRLICGDSLNPETYQTLMEGVQAQMCFTDPPYNVPINGHVCGNGTVKHTEFAMASGEMSEDQFIQFLQTAINRMIENSTDGSLHYICMDWRHMFELLSAGRNQYTELKNICVWNKDNGGMGSFYRSKHELVAVFKNGSAPYLNTIELGKNGRYRTNVWDYRGVNSFGNHADLEMHPTVKPVAMISDAIKDCTRRGHNVLDPFAGSGSTLIACEKSGRIARCIELEPKYCDVIVKRWQKLTGQSARHALTGQPFQPTASLKGA